jgi:hypothetical protein
MAEKFKAGGLELLIKAQERQSQLTHLVKMKSPLAIAGDMDNMGYKKVIDLEKQRRGALFTVR